MTKSNFQNQIEEVNKNAEKSGWFYLILVVAVLFLGLYFIMDLMGVTTDSEEPEISEQIESLHERIESLEYQLMDQSED